MKKILMVSLLALSASAFAQTATQGQQQGTTASSGSTATSVSNGGVQGQQQGIKDSGNSSAAVSGVTASNGLTVGCLVNCASTDQGTKDLAAASVTVATINAGAAKDIAAINAQAARDVAGTTQVIRNTPSVNASPLTSSNDTCMGSASGSINAPGIGLALGKTYTDANCVMLKNSRELWNMGMKAAALALMCTDAANREALELTGFECPQTTKAKTEKTAAANVERPEYTDPIVRARLGLAPLVASK